MIRKLEKEGENNEKRRRKVRTSGKTKEFDRKETLKNERAEKGKKLKLSDKFSLIRKQEMATQKK